MKYASNTVAKQPVELASQITRQASMTDTRSCSKTNQIVRKLTRSNLFRVIELVQRRA